MRYANAAMTHEKEITLDLTLDSLSNTAMEAIQEMTSVISAIKVILFIMAAHPLKRKQSNAITKTVIIYFSQPPVLNMMGMSSAAHMIPNNKHFNINISKASINTPSIITLLKKGYHKIV